MRLGAPVFGFDAARAWAEIHVKKGYGAAYWPLPDDAPAATLPTQLAAPSALEPGRATGSRELTLAMGPGRMGSGRTGSGGGMGSGGTGSGGMGSGGMAFTIEPGLYIPADDAGVPAKWRGIGIRIEDDVLVTATGHRVLTDALERSADEIETLMAAATA